jgi:lysophospholipase L1-like esterase
VRPARAAAGLCALALVGCGGEGPRAVRVIACIGDSITQGIVTPFVRDSAGGFPGRLQRRLGDRVRVRNHGVGAATAGLWLLDPGTVDGARAWEIFTATMPDPPQDASPATGGSLVSTLLARERPDLVILLLGVNDVRELQGEGAASIDTVARRVDEVYRQAASLVPVVLIATLLPNARDPAALVEAVSARIRAGHPDFLPLGERFAAAGGTRLLADGIHPSEEGHEVLAAILAEELARRGYVTALPQSSATSRRRPASGCTLRNAVASGSRPLSRAAYSRSCPRST